jgi:XapX domain-containing protein
LEAPPHFRNNGCCNALRLLTSRDPYLMNRAPRHVQATLPTNQHRDGNEIMNDLLISLALGLGIGVGCRWFDLPLPAPPKLVGALLVVSITLGFIGVDHLLRGAA